MRAAVVSATGGLEVAQVPEPSAGRGQVVVAVEHCGICGSDLHLRRSGMLPPGTVMGHELGGSVVEVGDGVTDLIEGQRVAVFPSAPCGHCRSCADGRHEICLNLGPTAMGLGPVPGGFAERVVSAAASCFPLPQTTSPELGALTEPYAVGIHAVRRADVRPGDAVAIIGAGPIGLMTLAALRADGVTAVAVAERSENRAAAAHAMGATVVSDATRLDTALGTQPDVVFECAGNAAAAELAVQLARPGGRVVLVGVAGLEDPISLVGVMLIVKEVDLLTSLGYTLDEFEESVRALAAGAIDPSAVVSAVRPLEEAEAAFDDLERPGGPIKVMLSPG